jgi:predicted porin
MNKKLVALAVAGVLSAPLAAQAQTANVTLYGRLNITLEGVNQSSAGTGISESTIYRVSSNSSRLGVRGTESLGGGLNAIFQIESSISGDAGGGTLAGRETFVGLQGGWGTVKVGNFLAPYDDIHPIFGNVPTLTTSILSTASIWAQGPSSKAQGGFDARLGNSIRYDSPNIAGFTGSIQASTNENTFHGMIYSMGGYYNAGPFQAGLAYERNQSARGDGLNDDAISVAGGWNFGIGRVAGVYERLKYDVAAGGDLKRDFYGISGTFNLGPGQLYAFWGHANDGKGSSADGSQVGGLVRGADTSSDEYTISYTYPLSKRTLTYVGYVKIDNDNNARYTFNINPLNQSAVTGGLIGQGKPQGLVAGIVHFF